MPHSGQAQWRLGRKGAKAAMPGGGGVGRPAAHDGASGKGLVPALLPWPRALDAWWAEQPHLQLLRPSP